jgi:microcompartment protein CcmL/EutN
MAELNSIGLIEVTSIAVGHLAEDAMLKTAPVELLLARTICSGKYLIVVGGDVASVQAAVEAGASVAAGALVEQRLIPHVHPSVFPAIAMAVDLTPEHAKALGIIETFSASSIIEVADAAVKSADVTLLRIHVATAIGGKGFVLLAGEIADVDAAVTVGAGLAGDEGILVGQAVIAAPRPELFREYT